jgi:hypothetical protein
VSYAHSNTNLFLNELYEYCLNLQFPQKVILEVILTSRDPTFGKPLLLTLASREVNITFQRLLLNDLNKYVRYA